MHDPGLILAEWGQKRVGLITIWDRSKKHYSCVCNEFGRALCFTNVHFSLISYVPALRKKRTTWISFTHALRQAGSMKICSLFG